jgi:drug/metabolite transporter (DMT)-like permease
MPLTRLFWLVLLAMMAFAGNSLLCRAALRQTTLDAATFTLLRLISGALVLSLLARGRQTAISGSWLSALALFVYAGAFSLAYLTLTAGTGALLLFGAVQATMILTGLWAGERLNPGQVAGLALALSGLVILLLPGLAAPPLGGALLMLAAGVAWGVYSLRGRGVGNPLGATAGNFLRAVPLGLLLSLLLWRWLHWDATGALYAVVSGGLASGLGYALWYTAVRELSATRAATVQLSVPIIAAAGGIVLLGEPLSGRLLLAAATILSGIAFVVYRRQG